MSEFWKGKKVAVLGGCSFIGSHLTEALVGLRAQVKVVDDLSTGKREHLKHLISTGTVPLLQADLRDPDVAFSSVAGRDIVFHLAAAHGGRGYVDRYQADCAGNLALDGLVLRACVERKIERVVFASSGCVYPGQLQRDPKANTLLSEDMAGPPYDADGMYGWAKLMAEKTLTALVQEGRLKGASARIFVCYGPRMGFSHAVLAMLARAFTRQNPFEVWGDGSQIRNFTHVSDTVKGLLLLAEHVTNGSAVNIGTNERIQIKDAARMACEIFSHKPDFKFLPNMPTGPLNRVADNNLAKRLLGWEPRIGFSGGLLQTSEWLVSSYPREEVRALLETKLIAR